MNKFNDVLIDKKNIQRTFQEDTKYFNIITNFKKKCRCGHTQVVLNKKDREFVICTYCGNYLYADDDKQVIYYAKKDKDKFISNLKKVM